VFLASFSDLVMKGNDVKDAKTHSISRGVCFSFVKYSCSRHSTSMFFIRKVLVLTAFNFYFLRHTWAYGLELKYLHKTVKGLIFFVICI